MKKRILLLIKAMIVITFWSGLVVYHSQLLSEIWSDSSQSKIEKTVNIFRQLMGIDYQPDDKNATLHQISQDDQTSEIPITVDESVLENSNYQYGLEVSKTFNLNIDIDQLNQEFMTILNQKRETAGWDNLYVGEHLSDGVKKRATELSNYHYLGKETLSGNDFRSLFLLDDAKYRLGENLYELYLSADDIHLKTWQNPEILAEYLFDVLESSIMTDLYQPFSSFYLDIVANASIYQVDNLSYVRLVVVLVMDIY